MRRENGLLPCKVVSDTNVRQRTALGSLVVPLPPVSRLRLSASSDHAHARRAHSLARFSSSLGFMRSALAILTIVSSDTLNSPRSNAP
jgi:hypothetical protein